MSESDEFDHYLSDNDLDLESIDLIEQSINSLPSKQPANRAPPPQARPAQPSRASVAPVQPRQPVNKPAQPVQRVAVSNARPSASFLRPPKPPPRQNKPTQQVVTSPQRKQQPTAAEETAPAAKRRRVSLNEKGQEGFVDPNPFNANSTKVSAIKEEEGSRSGGRGGATTVNGKVLNQLQEEEYVEEDMPEIRMREGENGEMLGYEVEPRRGKTVLPRQLNTTAETNRAGSIAPAEAEPRRLVRRVNGNQRQPSEAPRNIAEEEVLSKNRSTSVARPDPEGRISKQVGAAVSGVPSGMSEAEKQELEELRREKAKLKAALETSEKERKKHAEESLQRAGEASLVRSKLSKAEQIHIKAMEQERIEREKLAETLRAKEQELHNHIEQTKTKEAFAQIEQNSSARKSTHRSQAPGSSQRSVNRGLRGASVPAASGRVRDGESPSIGRSRGDRASSARPSAQQQPQIQAPAFRNFHNSFADPPRASSPIRRSPKRNVAAQVKDKNGVSIREEQEGSMAPPPFPMTGGKNRKSALKSTAKDDKKGKGKERASPEEDESFFSEGHGGEVSFDTTITEIGGRERYVRIEEEDEEGAVMASDWEWVEEERDWRGEILAAVFSHTTFNTVDTSSVLPITVPLPTQLRATAFSSLTAPNSRSYAYSTSTLTARSTHQPTSTRSSTSMSRQNSHNSSTSYSLPLTAETAVSTGPLPTFHSLMNLRFPPHSSPEHVTSYETATRNLFTLLGRRMDPRLPLLSQTSLPYPSIADLDPTTSAYHLCSNLSHSFQVLLIILDEAGLIGPITALLSLINHLVYLFPSFAKSILENSISDDDEVSTSQSRGLLSIVAKMITRYGKIPSPSSVSSSQSLSAMDKRPFQNRRSKQAARNASSRAKKKNAGEEDRVIIEDSEKRESLLKELAAIFEGLAWRYSSEGLNNRNAEDQFSILLKTPHTISTLLDPNQPVSILLSSTRALALLAPHTVFYREILAIKISDSSDVRSSPLPIFDRIASLLNLQSESSEIFELHSALLLLSSSLLTHQVDSLRLVPESPRFISEGLLKRIYRDVDFLWEWDGRSVGSKSEVRNSLRRTTQRLYSCMSLLYYLLFAPHSSISLPTVFANSEAFRSKEARSSSSSQLSYVQDWCSVALGTLAFSEEIPSWAEPEEEGLYPVPVVGQVVRREAGEGEEGARLMDMKYLAQEILEEMLPDELEGIGECFGFIDEEEEEEENEGLQDENGEENRMEE
ncbi:hypothetical protein JCM3765_000148 [Sporobolomyces pararoseus]